MDISDTTAVEELIAYAEAIDELPQKQAIIDFCESADEMAIEAITNFIEKANGDNPFETMTYYDLLDEYEALENA